MNVISQRGIIQWILLLCFIIFGAILLLGGCANNSVESGGGDSGTNQKVYKWRMVTHQIPGTARYEGTVVPFVEMVEKASNGRLIIEPFGGGNLMPTADTFDAVANGVVEMAAIYAGFWAGKDPVFALAGGFPGDPINSFSEHYYRSEKLEPILNKIYEKHGIKSLGAFDYGPSEILMSTVPIRSLADFSGKNIRAAGFATTFYEKLNASSISVAAPEIYTALQLGTVDAAEYNDYLVNQEMGLHEVTKYVIEPALHVGPVNDKDLIINPKAWAELPEDLQQIVISARDMARFLSAINYEVENKKAKQIWLDAGVEIVDLPSEDINNIRELAFELLVDFKNESVEAAEFIDTYGKVLYELDYIEEARALGYVQ